VRPSGFEPETCGAPKCHVQTSVAIRISWSEATSCPPMSEEVRRNLLLWLQDWLHLEQFGELNGIRIEVSDMTSKSIDPNSLE